MRFTNPVLWIFLAAIINAFAAYFTLREQDAQTRELQGWMTGGDSYAYFEPLRRNGWLKYFIRQTGRYPAYDVVVRVQDGDSGQLIEGPIIVGTVAAGSGLDWLAVARRLWFPDPPPADARAHRFRVELQTRNAVTVQRLQIWPDQGRWQTESRDLEQTPARPLPRFREAQEQ